MSAPVTVPKVQRRRTHLNGAGKSQSASVGEDYSWRKDLRRKVVIDVMKDATLKKLRPANLPKPFHNQGGIESFPAALFVSSHELVMLSANRAAFTQKAGDKMIESCTRFSAWVNEDSPKEIDLIDLPRHVRFFLTSLHEKCAPKNRSDGKGFPISDSVSMLTHFGKGSARHYEPAFERKGGELKIRDDIRRRLKAEFKDCQYIIGVCNEQQAEKLVRSCEGFVAFLAEKGKCVSIPMRKRGNYVLTGEFRVASGASSGAEAPANSSLPQSARVEKLIALIGECIKLETQARGKLVRDDLVQEIAKLREQKLTPDEAAQIGTALRFDKPYSLLLTVPLLHLVALVGTPETALAATRQCGQSFREVGKNYELEHTLSEALIVLRASFTSNSEVVTQVDDLVAARLRTILKLDQRDTKFADRRGFLSPIVTNPLFGNLAAWIEGKLSSVEEKTGFKLPDSNKPAIPKLGCYVTGQLNDPHLATLANALVIALAAPKG